MTRTSPCLPLCTGGKQRTAARAAKPARNNGIGLHSLYERLACRLVQIRQLLCQRCRPLALPCTWRLTLLDSRMRTAGFPA